MDKGIFLGYSNTSKAHRAFNSKTQVVEESIHVKFNDNTKADKDILDLENSFEFM